MKQIGPCLLISNFHVRAIMLHFLITRESRFVNIFTNFDKNSNFLLFYTSFGRYLAKSGGIF